MPRPKHLSLRPGTLTFLINGEALINGEGGKFFKFNKRGGPNKRGGWNFFPNLINGEGRINGEGQNVPNKWGG